MVGGKNKVPIVVHGIDPGFSGAIATVIKKGDELSVVDVQDMPTKLFYYGKDKKGRRGYDLDKLMLYLKARLGSKYPLLIESNLIMDSDSRYSTASTAFGAGTLLGMSHALGINSRFVSPRSWQAWTKKWSAAVADRVRECKDSNTKPDSKRLAELFVRATYPKQAHLISGPRGGLLDGRADAICIATYGACNTV